MRKISIYQQKTEKFFNKYVSRKKNLDLLRTSKAGELEFEKFFNFLNLPKGSNLIELGSGYGRFVLQLLKRGYGVTGVDISQESLDILENQAIKNGIERKLKLIRSDFSKPVYLNKFDGAYCISTFHLLANEEKDRIIILSNLVKAVKKNGVIVLIEPNPLNLFYYPFYWFSDQVSWEIEKTFMKSSEFNLKKIFKKLGLTSIEISYMGFLPNRFINNVEAVKYLNGFVNLLPILNKFSSFIYIKGIKK